MAIRAAFGKQDILPPEEFAKSFDEIDMRIWNNLVETRHPADWPEYELANLIRIVRLERKWRKMYYDMDNEPDVLYRDNGTAYKNPFYEVAHSVINDLRGLYRDMGVKYKSIEDNHKDSKERFDNMKNERKDIVNSPISLIAGTK